MSIRSIDRSIQQDNEVNLKCNLCQNLIIDAVNPSTDHKTAVCFHAFCKECFEKLSDRTCPECGNSFSTYVPDEKMRSKITEYVHSTYGLTLSEYKNQRQLYKPSIENFEKLLNEFNYINQALELVIHLQPEEQTKAYFIIMQSVLKDIDCENHIEQQLKNLQEALRKTQRISSELLKNVEDQLLKNVKDQLLTRIATEYFIVGYNNEINDYVEESLRLFYQLKTESRGCYAPALFMHLFDYLKGLKDFRGAKKLLKSMPPGWRNKGFEDEIHKARWQDLNKQSHN